MMGTPARKLDDQDMSQSTGRVMQTDKDVLVVRTGRGAVRARRAVSCLVEPREGDFVLLSTGSHESSYVLAILEREEPGAEIACDGDLDIRLKSGRFRVASQEGVDLVSPKDVSVMAGRVSLHARAASCVLDQLSYLGAVAHAEVGKIALKGGIIDSALERISQRVRRSFRTVAEIDQVRAERIDYAAKQTMCLRGENALITAEELVKMDGEQIHMG